jgi:hypothetical protein
MDADRLAPLLDEWDEAMDEQAFAPRSDILMRVQTYVPEDMRFSGSRVVKYSNPEIHRRIVEQYVLECEKRNVQPDVRAYSTTNPWYAGEAGAVYLELLSTIAESTFSARIYDMVLLIPECRGDLRELYLAKVDCEVTLNTLLTATFENKLGKKAGRDTFYTTESGRFVFTVPTAFDFLVFARELAPDVLLRQRDSVRAFVTDHALNYATPRKYEFRSKPLYHRHDDYRVRRAAMSVLELVAKPEDIPVVRSLLEDIPTEPEDQQGLKDLELALRDELGAKADEIIARLTG